MQKKKNKSKRKEISEALIMLQHRWPLKAQSKRNQTQEATHGARLFMWTTYIGNPYTQWLVVARSLEIKDEE